WSRRIDAENRLIYMVESDRLCILSLKDHYG
ncbi:type II toxin-antitoxin system YoeB family toxin, partial [Streptococcus suis]